MERIQQMIKSKIAKTRIYLVTGGCMDVQGKYEIVQNILDNTSARWAHFALVNGTPVSVQISWIAYISKI